MDRYYIITKVFESRGAVAQSVERPSKGPGSRCNSTDVGSNHAYLVIGKFVEKNNNPSHANLCCERRIKRVVWGKNPKVVVSAD